MVSGLEDWKGYEIYGANGNYAGKVLPEKSNFLKSQSWQDPVRILTVEIRDGTKINVRTDELETPGFIQKTLDLRLRGKTLIWRQSEENGKIIDDYYR